MQNHRYAQIVSYPLNITGMDIQDYLGTDRRIQRTHAKRPPVISFIVNKNSNTTVSLYEAAACY